MIKFKDNQLKQGLIEGIEKLRNCDNRDLYIQIDDIKIYEYDCGNDELEFIKCIGEEYSEDELEELSLFYNNSDEYIINGQEEMIIYLDEQESMIECTIDEFIELIKKVECASINDDGICVCDNFAIIRVSAYEFDFSDYSNISSYKSEIRYRNCNINLNIDQISNIYSLLVFINSDFNEYYPVKLSDDLFIEMSFDKNISLERIKEIYNVYIYEIFIRTGLKLELNPRFIYVDGVNEEEKEDNDTLDINDKLFTKGMSDVISIFNKAEGHNDDRAIVEYVKVIEYVGVTAAREELGLNVKEKLNQLDVENLNMDYISELGDIYLKNKKTRNSDRDLIKLTVKKCCNIQELSKYAPKFINDVREINTRIIQEEGKKESILNDAYGKLSQSISDTRNNISHAKANYDTKGLECPDSQKKEFIILLRNVCIQVIEWFYNTDESIRVVK